MQKMCWVVQRGVMPYQQAWEWQKALAEQVAQGALPPILVLLEHPHTYTIGRRGSADHILWNEEALTHRQIAVHWVDRGGDVTYHGPGQLVGYPVFPLARVGLSAQAANGSGTTADVLSFVEKLEQILIGALGKFGIRAAARAGMRGVWIPMAEDELAQPQEWRKIASIGVKLTAQGVTMHGFALNVNPQMEYWEGIIPCGIDGCRMTSVAEILNPLPPKELVVQALLEEFERIFQLSMIEVAQLPFDTSPESHYTIG